MGNRPRLTLIGNAGSWHVAELLKRCQGRAEGRVVCWADLAAVVSGSDERFLPTAVAVADAVLVRGMPTGSLEQVIGRMDILGRLEARGRRVLNRPAALEVAIDKYLTTARLAAAGLPVIPSAVVQSAAQLQAVREEFGGRLVVKPLFGSNGRGLTRVDSADDLPALLANQGAVLVQQQIANEGWDARILVVGEQALAMKRVAAPGEWRTNVALGGTPMPFTPPPEWIDLARRAAAAIGAELAGIDLLPGADGAVWLLEANAVPGWRALQRVIQPDIASLVLDQAINPR